MAGQAPETGPGGREGLPATGDDRPATGEGGPAGGEGSGGGAGASPGGRGRSPAGRLYSTVLIMEAIVIGLAIPVAITIEHVHAGLAGIVGGVAVAAVVVLAAAAARGSRLAVAGGTVVQALLIVAGLKIPAMLIIGVIFVALWAASVWLGQRLGPA